MSSVLKMHEKHSFREGRWLVVWEVKGFYIVPSHKRIPHVCPCCGAGQSLYQELCVGRFTVNTQ